MIQTQLPQPLLLPTSQPSINTLLANQHAAWVFTGLLTDIMTNYGLSVAKLSYSRHVDWINIRETCSLPSLGQGKVRHFP